MTEYSVVIPAFNEETSIKKVLGEIKSVMSKTKRSHEIIVVDDGSEDRTQLIVKKVKGLKLITHETNKGYGASLKDAIRKARGKWIIITDADGTYSVKDIPKLLKHTKDYDMIIGARTSKNVPILRKPAKWILGKLSDYITNSKISDLNSGMRVFRKDLALNFWSLFPAGFSFTTTLTIASICNDYNVKYVDIDYFKRSGKSSIRSRDFVGFVKLLSKIALYFRPLKVFFPASLLIFLFGVLRGVRDIMLTNSLGDLSVILCLSALQVFFFGLLAELIVNRNTISDK